MIAGSDNVSSSQHDSRVSPKNKGSDPSPRTQEDTVDEQRERDREAAKEAAEELMGEAQEMAEDIAMGAALDGSMDDMPVAHDRHDVGNRGHLIQLV